MKKLTLVALLTLGAALNSNVMAEDGPERSAAPEAESSFDTFLDNEIPFNGKFSIWVELATDYVFRGESETNDGDIPSLKTAVTWTHDSGAYVGLYMANNLFPGNDSEGHNPNINAIYGPYIGYAGEIGDSGLNYNGFLFQYLYPGDSDSNYLEMFNYVDKQFGDVNIKLEYSPTLTDWFGVEGVQSHNVAIHPSIALPHGFALSGSIGRQMFQSEFDANWTHWNVGVSRNVFGFNVDLRYHDTDIKIGDNDFYGFESNNHIVDSRFVAAISKTF
jgi:uncharacterized protein (TIGR02001 family)